MLNPKKLLSVLIGSLMYCGAVTADQQVIDTISRFGVNVAVTDNFAAQSGTDCAALGADWGSCYLSTLTLTNPGDAVTSQDWAIWFSGIRQVLSHANDQFNITHITGDLYKLTPTEKFRGFPAGQAVSLPLISEYWQLAQTDVMPRWYVTSSQGTAKVITATDTEDMGKLTTLSAGQWKRTPEDANIPMTPENRYLKNQLTAQVAPAVLRGAIIPTPLKQQVRSEDINLSRGISLDLQGLPAASVQVIKESFKAAGIRSGSGYPVTTQLSQRKDQPAGSYQLEITPEKTSVTAVDAGGLFNGLQSLLQLVPLKGEAIIPAMTVSDEPRFAYRAVFIDVGRNFHSKQAVLRTLQQMSRLKLNVLHLHLSDDEGWRLEIPGLPELTEVGGKRCHDTSETQCLLPQLGSGPDSTTNGSGYFTRQDYIEILRYAGARQIEVIPEFDMPAHARAAVVSMEARYKKLMAAGKPQQAQEYRLQDEGDDSQVTTVQFYDRKSFVNPCLPSTSRFVDKVMNEVISMHREAGQPLTTWHFGGDEAKNIYRGAGYTGKANPEPSKGQRDLSQQDMPWAKSAACRTLVEKGSVKDLSELPGWFALQVSQQVKAAGLNSMQAWQDGLKAIPSASQFATTSTRINFWDTLFWGGVQDASDWSNKGYQVIVSNPDYLYLDMPYEVDPQEPGYYWAARFSDEQKIFTFSPDNLAQNAETSVDRDGKAFSATTGPGWKGAYGMSAQVWSEVVRTDEQMEYRLYPRLFSVAERAWHKAGWEGDIKPGQSYEKGKTHTVDQQALTNDWSRFASLLGNSMLARLDAAGISYRIPVPGARISNGQLQANTSLPGLPIEYSTDNGKQWVQYQPEQPPVLRGVVSVRAKSPDGQRSSRVVTVNAG